MKPAPRVLIVEDERALALAFAAAVRRSGAASDLAPTAAQARRRLLGGETYDALVIDIGLPDGNGLDFLAELPESVRRPTLVVTAHGQIENTIAARKLGVRAFFTKPLDFDAFAEALASILAARGPGGGAEFGEDGEGGPVPRSVEAGFVGAAPAMRQVFRQIARACACVEPVLIRGETGSGKSLAAELVHQHGPASAGPLETVPGAAAGLAELERALEAARGGTLVVEDVGALGPQLQAALVHRLGAGFPACPRLVATVAGGLEELLDAGGFRSDLFYRLHAVEIHLPPLRARKEDLPALLDRFAREFDPGRGVRFSAPVLERLVAHDWPGNLRELRNTVLHSLDAACGGRVVEARHLPRSLAGPGDGSPGECPDTPTERDDDLAAALRRWLDARLGRGRTPSYRELSEELERALLGGLMPRYGGKLARLAKELGANRATLRRRLRKNR